jgi:FixJ family two-component response regulator
MFDFNINTKTTAPVVYLLDPDRDHLARLESLVAGEGFKSLSYTSVDDFLEALPEDHAGCLILEANLPKVDGLKLQQILMDRQITLPLIFTVGSASVDQGVSAMRAGAVDFIEKPVQGRRLLDAVNHAVKKDAKSREKRALRREVDRRMRSLTKREHEAMRLVFHGRAVKQIAASFRIGVQTAAKHRSRMLVKMKVPCDSQLVRLCMSAGVEIEEKTSCSKDRHPVSELPVMAATSPSATEASYSLVD